MNIPEKLFILPFDHRSYFFKKIGAVDREPSDTEKQLVKTYKHIVYQGFLKSIDLGLPIASAGILVDDVYGKEILHDAKNRGITIIQTTEISGLEYFDFEHGNQAENFLIEIMPNYAKALVRLDPRNTTDIEQTSITNLKKLNDICKKNSIGFLIEPLFFPNESDKKIFGDDKRAFDEKVRPVLVQQLMDILYTKDIKPDIWKIEGFSQPENYLSVTKHLDKYDSQARIIILGRNETPEFVEKWINAGKNVSGVIGFAVGRTIFDNALDDYQSGKSTLDQTTTIIANNFYHYYQLFNK